MGTYLGEGHLGMSAEAVVNDCLVMQLGTKSLTTLSDNMMPSGN